MGTFFAAAGRLAVRFRWAIVLAWAAGAAAAMALLPSLSSVTQSDNTSFLPASAPSEQAAQLASPLQGVALTAVTVVAARSGGALTGPDEAFVDRLKESLARIPRVVSVRDAGQSADGQAEQITVLAALAQSGGLAASQQATLVGQVRDAIRAAAREAGPPGFSVHTAGTVAARVDTNATSGKTGGQVQWFSIAFVIALLVAVFRSALAPLIAVLPAVVVVLAAERLTAEAAVHGLGVSQIASLLLIVLVLGGIYSGLFTPTEAAAVSAVYAFVVAVFVYSDLKLSDIPQVLLSSANMSAMILYIITNAVLFSFLMANENIPQQIAAWITSVGVDWVIFLLLVNLLLLLAGNVMEASSIVLIMAPILFPVAVKLGIHPVHLGILMVVNMEVGMCHPPVGLNLYVASGIAKMGITELTIAV
ncbi:MAG TPA: TRAP transporter large permease subunit, partial [Streptosporangiaceae bacterium]|nr:TRAP transporter large permease subunit [Streptosporangiaceae bacterium]